MRVFLLSAAMLAALAVGVPAIAGDRPIKASPPLPLWTWTGFYVGANAGYAWNHDDGALQCINPKGVSLGAGCGLIPFGGLDASEGFGGGQAGYDRQFGKYVLGVETDLQGADIRGSTSTNGPWPFVGVPGATTTSSVFTASQRIDWFGTARGRIGYAGFEGLDRTLIYATGGLAYGHVELQTAVLHPRETYSASGTAVRAGWTVGGGIEHAFYDRVSGKIEGLYYDLGDNSISAAGVPHNGFVRGKDFETRGALIRAGVNYKFD
jgi:outer membrane immunogenic protein